MPTPFQRPRKRFGQHFLRDASVVAGILAAIQPKPGEHLVEIGPGRGALTLPLLDAVGQLDAIELDRDLIEELRHRCERRGNLRLHQGDALRFDFCALASAGERLRLVGNLPYNISTPLLLGLSQQRACLQDLHFMVQKEVADRLAAPPGDKQYGRLSVMVQRVYTVQQLFAVSPQGFFPRPKVDSCFVRLIPWEGATITDEDAFTSIVAAAFAHRRKTLRNALAGLLDPAAIESVGVESGVRAEQLDLAAFARLSEALSRRRPPS